MDTAYYIIRELMNTERTYKKDIEVIAVVSSHLFYSMFIHHIGCGLIFSSLLNAIHCVSKNVSLSLSLSVIFTISKR